MLHIILNLVETSLVINVYELINHQEYRNLYIYLKCGFNYSLFQVNGDDLESFGYEESPLFSISLLGNNLALRNYKNVNIINNKGYSPLLWAVLNNQLSTVISLLKMGADINVRNDKNENILHIACKFQSYEVLVYLLNILPKNMLLKENNRGFTPFLLACGSGNLNIIRHLIKIIDIDSLLKTNMYKASCLHWLSYHCKNDDNQYIEIMTKIIRQTQNKRDFYKLLEKNAVGFSPIDWLCKNKSYLAAKTLNKI